MRLVLRYSQPLREKRTAFSKYNESNDRSGIGPQSSKARSNTTAYESDDDGHEVGHRTERFKQLHVLRIGEQSVITSTLGNNPTLWIRMMTGATHMAHPPTKTAAENEIDPKISKTMMAAVLMSLWLKKGHPSSPSYPKFGFRTHASKSDDVYRCESNHTKRVTLARTEVVLVDRDERGLRRWYSSCVHLEASDVTPVEI